MVDNDRTSLASGAIGAVLGPLIGEPLKVALGSLGRPVIEFVRDGLKLESIIVDVNKSDDLRLLPELAECMECFHTGSDEYIKLNRFRTDLEELLKATIDGARNNTSYNRVMKSKRILACKKRVEEAGVEVRALIKRVEDNRGHYLVPTIDMEKPIVPRESSISSLKSLLQHGPEWILLHGPSGVGKTHLVRYTFQMPEVRQLFGWIAYIEVGQDNDEVSMATHICSQLQMLHGYTAFPKITNVGEAKQSIQWLANRTSNKKTLIILDDVWKPDILRAVNIKGVQKLVISPKANVLDQLSRDRIAKLEVNPMSHQDAYTLFCLHAFGIEEAPQSIRKYVELMITQCYGFPKVLEVMARYMAKNIKLLHDPTYWEHILEKVRRGNCDEREKIFKVLKLSYDDLSDNAKKLFLCSGMCPWPRDRDSRLYYWWLVLNSYEDEDYQRKEFLLANESLTDASLDGASGMMYELADYIIKTEKHPYFKFRACRNHTSRAEVIYGDTRDMQDEKVSDILSNDMPHLSVLDLDFIEPMHISLKSFSNLKFLHLRGKFITICGVELVVQLRYLALLPDDRCWCSYEDLLEGLSKLHHLEVLHIDSGAKCDGNVHLDFKFLKNLDRLNHLHIISKKIHPMRNSKYIGKMNHLQVLRLTSGPLDLNCPTFVNSLEKFCLCNQAPEFGKVDPVEAEPQKIAWLLNGTQKLQELELDTVRFKEVPSKINFPSLVSLTLNTASKYLPNGFESLHRLTHVTLDGGGALLELPCINKLPILESFELSGFTGNHFPESFAEPGAFPSLQKLFISNCDRLDALTIQSIEHLSFLGISRCSQLSQIEFKELKRVRGLRISGCDNLVKLHFQELKSVHDFTISECDNLVKLHFQELKRVGFLKIDKCDNLVELHFQELKSVYKLAISGCDNLVELHFQRLERLDWLYISQCNSLTQLDFIEHIPIVTQLYLDRCNRLTGIGSIPSLESLTLTNLPSLVEVGSFPKLSRLEIGFKDLARFEGSFQNVERLILVETKSEESGSEATFPDLVLFPRLEQLEVQGFTFKHLPPVITLLTGLKSLEIYNCPQLEALLEDHTQFSSLVNLERLELRNLPELSCLPDCIGTLPALKEIRVRNCPGLEIVSKGREMVWKDGKPVPKE